MTELPKLTRYVETKLRPMFEEEDISGDSKTLLRLSSESQRQITRLLDNAFCGEDRVISPEVKASLYRIDIVLDLKDRDLYNLAIEVSSPVTKQFRTAFPSPGQRIRDITLRKLGYKLINIDT